jgi:hypothetical protein
MQEIKMRNLTHYELLTLIEKEINNLAKDAFNPDGKGVSIHYAKARAQDILKYCDEYFALEPIED